MTMCDCGDWADWPAGEDGRSETIELWDDLHRGLNGAWRMIERDLQRTCSVWVLEECRRDWFRKQLASLSPEVVSLLSRGVPRN